MPFFFFLTLLCVLLALSPLVVEAKNDHLVAVVCQPQCSFFALDPATGGAALLARVPATMSTYVRPGIGAADLNTGEYFWSFPQANNGDVYTFSAATNGTGVVHGFSAGVVSIAAGGGFLIAVSNPSANFLGRSSMNGGVVVNLAELGPYNVSGHEYVSALDAAGQRIFITGDDLTAQSAQLVTCQNIFGLPSDVVVKSVTYSGFSMLRMNYAASKLYAIVYFFGLNSRLVSLDPATGAPTTVLDFGHAIQRAEFAIDPKTGTAYVLEVPTTLYTIDLRTGKMLNKVSLQSPMFGSEVVNMVYV